MGTATRKPAAGEAESGLPLLSQPWALRLGVLVYCVHALLALPLAGLQYDELLHLHPILPPQRIFGFLRLGDTLVPTMILPYLGCLKSWLVWPWLEWLPRTTETIRIPAIAVGAAALGLSGAVLRRLAGATVATIVVWLAALDVTFVFCTTYDWGPVGLQLLLIAAVAWGAVRFQESGALPWALLAAFCAGLAIWNKALALWTLGALGLALGMTVPLALRRWLSWKPLAGAVVSLVLGAFPFLAWNKKTHGATFRDTQGFSLAGALSKGPNAWGSLDGSLFLGYMIRGELQQERGPSSAELPWLRTLRAAGWRLGNGVPFALLLSMGLSLWLVRGPRRKLWLAALLALLAMLFQMMVTNGAGTGMHHYVLLFPLPFLLIAIPLSELAKRPGAARRAALVSLGTLLLWSGFSLHSQFAALRAWGPTAIWSTAIQDLVRALHAQDARQVFAQEWGTDSQLRYLLPPQATGDLGYEYLDTPSIPEEFRRIHLARLRAPATFYVRYEPPYQIQPGLTQAFTDFARNEGFREETVAIVKDAWGVPTYRILRYLPDNAQAPRP